MPAPGMRASAAWFLLALFLTAGCSDDGDGGDGDGPTASGSVSGGPSASAGAGAGGGSATTTGTGSQAGSGNGTGPAVDIDVAATGAYPVNPAFTPSTISVPAGALVHVTFSNDDPLPFQHNWIVEGITGASSDTIGSGQETAFDFAAPPQPGEFAYYCSVGDHRDRGMEGTLTVTA